MRQVLLRVFTLQHFEHLLYLETPAGADYTQAGCATWVRAGGFWTAYGEHLVGPDSIEVGIK